MLSRLIQLIAEGSTKLASVPSGGGGGGGAAAGGAAAGGAAAEESKEEAKEEGKNTQLVVLESRLVLTPLQRRRSPMRTWASVSSTKCLPPQAKKSPPG
jgi:hypothetical protein